MNCLTSGAGEQKRDRALPVVCSLLGLLLFLFPTSSHGQKASSDARSEPLGSLSSVGEVYVNDSSAPAESTVFAGDRVRTGATGIAIFTRNGSGTLKVAPQSQVVLPGSYEYTAELEAGTAVLHSITGGHEMTLRMGEYVLIPSVREESTTSKVERAPDGSFLVTCLDGSIGVLTLAGSSGEFLQTGQSVRVFTKPAAAVTASGPRNPAKSAYAREIPHKKGWTLLGLAGAGASALAFELAQGGKHSVSPSTP